MSKRNEIRTNENTHQHTSVDGPKPLKAGMVNKVPSHRHTQDLRKASSGYRYYNVISVELVSPRNEEPYGLVPLFMKVFKSYVICTF